MTGSKGLMATVAVFLVFTATAMAQVETPSQISFQGTALVTKDSTQDSTSHRATKSGGLLLGYSYQFNNWTGVEGNYGYTRNTQNYSGVNGLNGVEADVHAVTAAFVAHIPVHISKIRPYALAGAGALVFDPTGKSIFTDAARVTKPTFLYGGGVNFDLTRNFGVRTEYRGFVYKVPGFGIDSLTLDKVSHSAQPSVGFFVRF